MKKISMFFMAALLVLAVSCKKKEDESTVQGPGFRASLEIQTDDSKTHLEGETKVKWDVTDVIKVVNKNNDFADFTITGNIPEAGYADFQSEDATEAFYEAPFKGYYPKNLYNNTTRKVTLPETQTYAKVTVGEYENSSFGQGFNPMVAYATDNTLEFKNLCGMLALQLKGSCTVESIRITAKGGEKLWGTGYVTMDGTDNTMEPTLGTLEGGTSTITLNCNPAVTLSSTATTFYFVLPNNALAGGFDVLLTDSDGRVWKRSASADHNTTIHRNMIRKMAEQEVVITDPIVPEVTLTAGCTACSYTVSGVVIVPTSHTCELGFVYSETNDQPTINDSKIIVHSLSDAPIYWIESFTADVLELTEGSELAGGKNYYFRAYALIDGIAYSGTTEIVSTPYPNTWPNGRSPYPFTVSPSKQVYFSKGNLQYTPVGATATAEPGQNVGGTWRFAKYQFEMIHTEEDGDVSDEYNINYNGWIDLFGWGTSGVNHNNACYQPWSTNGNDHDYCAYSNSYYYNHLYEQTGKADWGVANTISNGGSYSWRTPTGNAPGETPQEWEYLISQRDNASNLHGEGRINCVLGLIILPDNWTWTGDVAEFASRWVPGESDWMNVYTFSEWAKMEARGAVFLPTAGARSKAYLPYFGHDAIYGIGEGGGYLSSTSANDLEMDYFNFQKSFIRPNAGFNKQCGYSVRLVSDAN